MTCSATPRLPSGLPLRQPRSLLALEISVFTKHCEAPLRRADAILAGRRLDRPLAVSLAVREPRQRDGRAPAVQYRSDLLSFGPDKEL